MKQWNSIDGAVISSLRVYAEEHHAEIRVWVHSKRAGTLIVGPDEWQGLVRRLGFDPDKPHEIEP